MSRATHPGLPLPSHKQLSRDAAIVSLPAPDTLVLPLNQHSDTQLTPCIEVGARVRKGQMIARPDSAAGALADASLSACLHSPVSGRVVAIEPRAAPLQPVNTTLSMVISNDHLDTPATTSVHSDWLRTEPLALCRIIAQGGIAGLGGAVFPTATKLAAHAHHSIEHLIVNGVECEPYITCDDRLMRERAAQVVRGAQILLHAAQAPHCLIAIEANKPEALAAMQVALNAAADSRIALRSIATAYPSGDEGQLITQLLGREIPRGRLPAEIGVIVQNVATAYACARWIEQGEPLISRIVTVTGSGIKQPANLEVSLGTSIRDVIAACGVDHDDEMQTNNMLVMGGAMMGRALAHDQLPIVKASNCLIVTPCIALKPALAELPCIRCGECAEACPVSLLPQQLLAFTRSHNHIALKELGLADCIECGCCDYVCPSNITLAARFHAAKQLTEH